jgi:hypothetical protein
VFDIKPLANFYCRLLKSGTTLSKMKVYPGMLLKTQGSDWAVAAYPGMYMKNKALIGGIREY